MRVFHSSDYCATQVAFDTTRKADAIAELRPVAFADDFLPFLRALPASVHTALIRGGPNRSPNTGPDLALARSIHDDLAGFVEHWLSATQARPPDGAA